MVTVANLLEQSRAAHKVYRQHAGRMKDGKLASPIQLDKCGEAVRTALRLRTEADALDPQHSDQAWAEDMVQMKATHAEMVAFYCKYLAPREAYAQAVI